MASSACAGGGQREWQVPSTGSPCWVVTPWCDFVIWDSIKNVWQSVSSSLSLVPNCDQGSTEIGLAGVGQKI